MWHLFMVFIVFQSSFTVLDTSAGSKIDFFFFGMVFKTVLKIAMFGRWASSEVYLLVNFFSKLYVTFILQWIAFIFGRDEVEDQ